MITEKTIKELKIIASDPDNCTSGVERKKFQSVYDKLLDELSETIFKEPCANKMIFRQKINKITEKTPKFMALAKMLKHDDLLFSKDYRDHGSDIELFIWKYLKPFLELI